MTRINIAQFKAKLPEYLDRLRKGESIALTNHGEEVIVLGSVGNVYQKEPKISELLKKIEARTKTSSSISGASIIRSIRDEE